MEQIIANMVKQAEETMDYNLIDCTKDLIEEFSRTSNCPSNWRRIGEELAEEYGEDSWVYENLELWNHIDY